MDVLTPAQLKAAAECLGHHPEESGGIDMLECASCGFELWIDADAPRGYYTSFRGTMSYRDDLVSCGERPDYFK